jgi:tetratricopeptide (TPR) repeat protein
MHKQSIDEAEDSVDVLHVLLGACARQLVADDDAEAFSDWFVEAVRHLAPALIAQAVEPDQFARVLARAIYSITPLPSNAYAPRRLPAPGRNEPCFCGSGRKYKHCCERLDAGNAFPNINMLRYVLDALPVARFAELAGSRAGPEALAHAAHEWDQEGAAPRAMALLEPFFAGDGPLGERHAPLFDELMSLYLDAGKERKRQALIEAALRRGDRALQSTAWQRRAVMLADRDRHDEAMEAFRRAQQLAPDDPALGFLEVSVLTGAGNLDLARERARFWLARARRADPPLSDEMFEILREAAADPAQAMLGVGRLREPDLGQLIDLFSAAPAPAKYNLLDRSDDGTAELRPMPELAAAEARWREVFPQSKPPLTMLATGDAAAFDAAAPWLNLLQTEPLLWQSFDVLDDLAMAVNALGILGADRRIEAPLLERAVSLLRIAVQDDPGTQLPWGCVANRPALRCVFARLHAALGNDDLRRAQELSEWLVLQLNPNDNHGLRGTLARLYLAAEQPDRAIALTDRYPEDFAEVSLNRVLALFMGQRRGDALTAFSDAARKHPVALKMLLANNPRRPAGSGKYGITVGGAEEAWLYREQHINLWRDCGALEWARQARRVLPRASGPGH